MRLITIPAIIALGYSSSTFALEVSINSPKGSTYSNDSPQLIEGNATQADGQSILGVQYFIRRLADFAYVDSAGNEQSWTPDYAILNDNGPSSLSWTASLNLGSGEYRLFSRAVAIDNSVSEWKYTEFSVISEDTAPPTITFTNASNPNLNNDSSLTLTGNVVDTGGSGTAKVQFTVRNLVDYSYHDALGNRTSWSIEEAELAAIGANQTTWSLDVKLPSNRYRLYARGIDMDDNVSDWQHVDFYVDSSDQTPPSIALLSGCDPSEELHDPVEMFGSAVDPDASGIQAVHYQLRDLSDFRFVDGQGLTQNFTPTNATLSLRGGTQGAVDWSVPTETLPSGTYRIYFRAIDNNGQASDWDHYDFLIT